MAEAAQEKAGRTWVQLDSEYNLTGKAERLGKRTEETLRDVRHFRMLFHALPAHRTLHLEVCIHACTHCFLCRLTRCAGKCHQVQSACSGTVLSLFWIKGLSRALQDCLALLAILKMGHLLQHDGIIPHCKRQWVALLR